MATTWYAPRAWRNTFAEDAETAFPSINGLETTQPARPLSPQPTGTYAGITIFQARTSNAQIVVSGSGALAVTGTVYAADALVNISGASSVDTFGTTLIADDLTLSGSGELLV